MGEKLKIQRRREIYTDLFRRRVMEEMESLDVPFRVVLEPIGPKVRTKQKGLYYRAVAAAADYAGYPTKTLDRYLRERYGKPIIIEEYGHELEMRPRFEDLSQTGRDLLIDVALALCAFLEISIDQGDARDEPRH